MWSLSLQQVQTHGNSDAFIPCAPLLSIHIIQLESNEKLCFGFPNAPLADLNQQLWKRRQSTLRWVSSTEGAIWTNGKEWCLLVREAASPSPSPGFRCMVLVVTAQSCECCLRKLLCFSCWPKKIYSYAHEELNLKFNQ